MSKKFINEVDDVVDDSLLGLVRSNAGLKFHPSCNRVVIRNNLDASKVSLIAGGGSGHEPYAAGYVGEGLLTAAVAGNIFASPPSRHVQAALDETKSKNGSILFVINYTGDRLNFGLAAERFNADGGNAKVVTITDDVAIDNPNNRVGRRGLAGATLTIKIAGAMSEKGKSLEEIYQTSKNVVDNLSTLGVSMYPGSLPGKEKDTHLSRDEIEIGLGIHGEPGKSKSKYEPVKKIIGKVLTNLKEKAKMRDGEEFVVMVNNLGGVSQVEMNIVNGEVINWFNSNNIVVKRLFSGIYMTSLDGHGISVTVLRLKENSKELLEYLDLPTKAPGWIPAISSDLAKSDAKSFKVPEEDASKVSLSEVEKSGGTVDESLLKKCLESIAGAMIDSKDLLNKLDGAAGDGDCGSTFEGAAKAIKSNLKTLSHTHPQTLLQQVAIIFEQTVGGTSGALYALMLSSAASSFKKEVSFESCRDALSSADKAIQTYGRARPGDRTMVDALNAAVESLKSSKNDRDAWEKAVLASEKAAESTASQKAAVGRASYTTEDAQHSPDAGATAISIWLRSIWDVVKGKI